MDALTQSPWYFLVSGILGLIKWRRDDGRIRRRTADAEGRVTAVDSRWWTRHEGGTRDVKICFFPRRGKPVIFTIQTAKYRVDDLIPVRYELTNPQNVGRIDDEDRNVPWLFVWSFFLLIGILTLIGKWHPSR
jgi:hypothetical protein